MNNTELSRIDAARKHHFLQVKKERDDWRAMAVRLEREAAELAIIAANQALGLTLEDLGLDSSGLMHPPTPEMIREFVQEGLLEVLP